jgi:hypothetical protein
VLLFAPVQTNNLWWREAINSGHTVLFFFLSFIIYPQVKARAPNSTVLIIYFYVLVIGLLFGIVIEILQTLVQREASLNDLYGNFFGLMAGICLHAAFTVKKMHHQKMIAVLLVLASAGFLLLGITPLMQLSWHYLERANAFPEIIDFDSSWSSSFMHYDEGRYPGVSIIEPEPDWSGYSKLRVSIHSVSERDINLVLRIHDKTHNQEHADRFNMKLLARPGFNEFQIPLNMIRQGPVERELDMKNIAGIIVFSSRAEDWAQVQVGNLSLE